MTTMTRKATRRATLVGGGLTAAALLARCAAPGNQSTPAGSQSAAPVRVNLMSRSSEQEAFTKRVTQFQEAHANVTVDYQALPGDYPTVVRTNAAAGTLGDVIYMQNLVFEGLAIGGSLQPIDTLVQRDKVNLKQWYDNGPAAVRLNGKLWGLPARGQIQNCYLYYNRDALGRAGIAEPADTWTLDDLVNAADKLTIRDGSRFGYSTSWGSFQSTTAVIRRFGGELLSADGKKCLADSPQALAAMAWHWDLWHRKQIMAPKGSNADDFGKGTVALAGQMLAGDRGAVRSAVKDSFKWSLILLPKGPTGRLGADLSVAPMGLNAAAKAVDQAWQVLQWFTDHETGVALALQSTGSNTPGMRRDVYCDDRVLDDPNFPREMMDRVCKAMDVSAPMVAYSVPANYRQPELNDVIAKHVNAFHDNTAAPTAATMRAFTAEVQAVLDQPRAG